MIIVNQYIADLEQIWSDLKWRRTFPSNPHDDGLIVALAHDYSIEEIKELRTEIDEIGWGEFDDETCEGVYSAHLFQTSRVKP